MIVLLSLIYVCPESPRFEIKRGRYGTAYQNLILLRFHPILAAKELLYIHFQSEVESRFVDSRKRHFTAAEQVHSAESKPGDGNLRRRRPWTRPAASVNYWEKLYHLFTVKRNRRAIVAAVVCMISQQLCGKETLATSHALPSRSLADICIS